MENIIMCPVCGGALFREGGSLKCENGHSFDFAKEGYVNLLLGSRSTQRMGDSRESAAARRAFLEKGYYSCLKEAITPLMRGTVLDICCGEGYYDDAPDGCTLYGFDLSKTMVRLAAKRKNGGRYFVANLAKIPVFDMSIDTAIHLFAPFNAQEFARVLKTDGRLYSVTPGREHLIEIKQAVYDNPYFNEEKTAECSCLSAVGSRRVKTKVTVDGDDLHTLFAMTPYYYRTSESDRKKLNNYDKMDVTLDFVITEFIRSAK